MADKKPEPWHDRPKYVYWKNNAWRLVDPVTGQWSTLGKTRVEAQERYEHVMGPSDPRLVSALLGRYEREVLPTKAPDTQRTQKPIIKTLRRTYGSMMVTDLKASDGWEHFTRRGGRVIALREIEVMRNLFTWCRRWGIREDNPWLKLQLPHPKKRKRPYVTDEMFEFARARAPRMLRYAMEIALHTGFRKRDIVTLKREHLTETGIMKSTSKTGKCLLVEWTPDLQATVKACLAEPPQLRQYLICRLKGRRAGDKTYRPGDPYTDSGFDTMWQKLMQRVANDGGQRFNFHLIRKKNASDETDLKTASRRLGHASESITMRVYRELPERVPGLKKESK